MAKCIYSVVYHGLFTYALFDGHLGCFPFLVILNTGSMNTHIGISFQLFFNPRNNASHFFNIFLSLLVVSTWCTIVGVPAFTSAAMCASFSSLNVFTASTLKSFSVKSNLWSLSLAISVPCFLCGFCCFLLLQGVTLSWCFAWLVIVVVVENWMFQIIYCSKSRRPALACVFV